VRFVKSLGPWPAGAKFCPKPGVSGGLLRVELLRDSLHAVVDVVADQAHAVDAIDAAFGGFVGVPDLDRGAVDGLNLGVPSEHDDPVGGRDEVVGELFRGLIGDVDPDLEEWRTAG